MLIYRGYTVERIEDTTRKRYEIRKDGNSSHVASSEDDALAWIDARKREEFRGRK